MIYNSLEKPFGPVWDETYGVLHDEATTETNDALQPPVYSRQHFAGLDFGESWCWRTVLWVWKRSDCFCVDGHTMRKFSLGLPTLREVPEQKTWRLAARGSGVRVRPAVVRPDTLLSHSTSDSVRLMETSTHAAGVTDVACYQQTRYDDFSFVTAGLLIEVVGFCARWVLVYCAAHRFARRALEVDGAFGLNIAFLSAFGVRR